MLYEYAIEPEVLTSWDKCRNTLNLMGFRHGRAISAYPTKKNWKGLVREACRRAGCKDREFLRIVEKLEETNSKMIRIEHSYDDSLMPPEERWVRNAISQQETSCPFHAILATQNPTGHSDVVLEQDIEETHPKLDVQREIPVLREANETAKHTRTLIRNSQALFLIDPHFEPHLDRWWPVVKACINETVQNGSLCSQIEIHTLDNEDKWDFAGFARNCRRNAAAFLPSELKRVRIVRWRIRANSPDDFHGRYILTDRGGYRLDKGLDEEIGITQPIALLDNAEWERLWQGYQEATPFFDKDNELTIP